MPPAGRPSARTVAATSSRSSSKREAACEDNPPGANIDYAFKGQDEEQKAAEAFLLKAFFIALFLMAIILVTQFNSFYQAFLILSAVVVSTVGAFLGLLATGQAFGIVIAGIGMIALAGVVVNDNIVLIDTYNQLRRSCKTPLEAILRTGVLRLRPVVLTTITTVLGLMPMFLKTNIDLVTREIAVGAPIICSDVQPTQDFTMGDQMRLDFFDVEGFSDAMIERMRNPMGDPDAAARGRTR